MNINVSLKVRDVGSSVRGGGLRRRMGLYTVYTVKGRVWNGSGRGFPLGDEVFPLLAEVRGFNPGDFIGF